MRRLPTILFVPFAVLCIAAGEPGTAGQSCGVGTIRLWGDNADRKVIEDLEKAYTEGRPGVCFANSLHGPESPIAGVYTGVADLAVMAREVREPMERMAFEWVRLDKPTVIPFAHGGFAPGRHGSQLAVVVNRDNPLRSISLAQLDALMGAESLRGLPAIRNWSLAGPRTKWAERPVAIYGTALDSPAMLFFRRLVMKNSRKWNPEYRVLPDDGAAVDAVARDASGLAVVALGAADQRVRILAVSQDGGPAILPERDAIISGTYPLTRTISIVVDRSKGRELRPEVKGFLHFVLAGEGQSVIARSKTHLPLSSADAAGAVGMLR